MGKTIELLTQLGAFHSKRTGEKNKLRFLSTTKDYIDKTTYKSDLFKMEADKPTLSLISKDIQKKATIIITYFDTPKYVPFFKYKPNNKKNLRLENLLAIIISVLGLALLAAPLLYFARTVWNDNVFNYKDILLFLYSILMLLYIRFFREGFKRRNNLIRNTSSVIVLINLLKSINNRNIGFALVDHGAIDNYGLYNLFNTYDFTNKKIIYLDSLGASNNIISKFKDFHDIEEINSNSIIIHPEILSYSAKLDGTEIAENINKAVEQIKENL